MNEDDEGGKEATKAEADDGEKREQVPVHALWLITASL